MTQSHGHVQKVLYRQTLILPLNFVYPSWVCSAYADVNVKQSKLFKAY